MYIKINKKLGISISENILKTLASGITTNLATHLIGVFTISTALTFFPVIGSTGAVLVMSSVTCALTIVSAGFYLAILTKIFKAKGIDINKMSAND